MVSSNDGDDPISPSYSVRVLDRRKRTAIVYVHGVPERLGNRLTVIYVHGVPEGRVIGTMQSRLKISFEKIKIPTLICHQSASLCRFKGPL